MTKWTDSPRAAAIDGEGGDVGVIGDRRNDDEPAAGRERIEQLGLAAAGEAVEQYIDALGIQRFVAPTISPCV